MSNPAQILHDIAEAIRDKTGVDDLIYPEDMADDILGINTGTDVSDTTAVAGDVAFGKIFHKANGESATGMAPRIKIIQVTTVGSGPYKFTRVVQPGGTVETKTSGIQIAKVAYSEIGFEPDIVICVDVNNPVAQFIWFDSNGAITPGDPVRDHASAGPNYTYAVAHTISDDNTLVLPPKEGQIVTIPIASTASATVYMIFIRRFQIL